MLRSTTAKCLHKLDDSPGIEFDVNRKWNWANTKPASTPPPTKTCNNTPDSFTFGWSEDRLKYGTMRPIRDQQIEECHLSLMPAGEPVKLK